MAEDKSVVALENRDIQNMIFTFRNKQVMLDKDLATLYSVETRVLNQAIKRNVSRFPEHFRFQLSGKEKNELVINCDRFETLKHSSSNKNKGFFLTPLLILRH